MTLSSNSLCRRGGGQLTTAGRSRFIAWLAFVLCALAIGAIAAAAVEAPNATPVATVPGAVVQVGGPRQPLQGMRLIDALLHLRSTGLPLVFTREVVRDRFKVTSEPPQSDPRGQLEALLQPFDLAIVDGPRETLIVVRRSAAEAAAATEAPRLVGIVRTRAALGPVAGAEVLILETAQRSISGLDGEFAFALAASQGPLTLEVRRQGYLPARLEQVNIRPASAAPVVIFLEAAPVIEEEMLVTTSRVSVLSPEGSAEGVSLSQSDIQSLPQLGDDLFRALSLLAGTAANDVSAEFHVRGGRRDETLVVLDGQELYEAYHLRDFDGALSVVSPATLDRADLATGGYPARYGDRMSGVLDLQTSVPEGSASHRVAISIANAQAGSSGTLAKGHGHWLFDYRRGSIDLINQLISNEEPEYWDSFGKLTYQPTSRHSLRLHALATEDRLDFSNVDGVDSSDVHTRYENRYLWLTHQALIGRRLLLETSASSSEIERARFGEEREEEALFSVSDQRDLRIDALRQSWSLQVTPRHSLELGFSHRDFDSRYDYRLETLFDDPLASVRFRGDDDLIDFEDRFHNRHTSFYASDRLLPSDRLTVQLGLRYDRFDLPDEADTSPRVNLAWALDERSVIRVAWGRFRQSQRVYELLLEDDDVQVFPVEGAEQWVLGYERQIGLGAGRNPLTLRLEAFRRGVDNPRPRYENLYEQLNTFPEAEPDRIRIAPENSLAEGLELFVRGRHGRFGWWINYTYATTEDLIDGRSIPRLHDQEHAVNLDLDFPLGKHWHLNLAWRFHSGWPTTPIEVVAMVDPEGQDEEEFFVPVLGPRNSERLPNYHRLDLRASRQWRRAWGSVAFFLDVQNLYDRNNIAGFDIEIDDEEGTLLQNVENWAGVLPSAGVRITF